MHKYFLRNGDFVEFKALDDGIIQIVPLVKVRKYNKK